MVTRERPAVLSLALPWLLANPAVPEAASKRIETSGKAVPDAVLEDPSRLVAAFKETIVQAIQADAPLGVVDELLHATRTLSGRVRRIDPYVRQELASLQGLRDPEEITPVLEDSLRRAPDEATKAGLQRLVSAANSIPHFLGPDGLDPGGVIDFGEGTGTTDPGPPDPGTTEPRTTTPETTDPGTTDTGTTTTGTDTTNAAAVEAGQMLANAGAQLGSQIGGGSGVPEDEQTGAVLGAQYATQIGTSFGTIAGEQESGDSATGTASNRFWGIVGALVGGALFGPAGVAAGYAFGTSFGSTAPGQAAVQGIGSVITAIGHELPPGSDVTTVMACILCGPTCILCLLAAESGGP
jgi:uncharacterized membrane protein YeaQ/YmgE (transglycosylase-associated protein family)